MAYVESTPLYTDIDDEDIEEEFKKLELEFESGNPQVTTPETEVAEAATQAEAQESAESLTAAFSSLGLKDGSAKGSAASDSVAPVGNNDLKHHMPEPA